jgi:predicted secreted protein
VTDAERKLIDVILKLGSTQFERTPLEIAIRAVSEERAGPEVKARFFELFTARYRAGKAFYALCDILPRTLVDVWYKEAERLNGELASESSS